MWTTVCEADRDEVGVGRDERGTVRDALHEDDPHALPLDLTPHLHRGGGTREAGRRGRGTCDTDLLGVVCASSRAWEGRVRSRLQSKDWGVGLQARGRGVALPRSRTAAAAVRRLR